MSIEKKVILLHGGIACGKLSVAKGLKDKYINEGKTVLILDNHFFNDWLFPYIDINSDSKSVLKVIPYVMKMRKIFLEGLIKANTTIDVFIFTEVFRDNKDNKNTLKDIKLFAKKINANFYPIEIKANMEQMKKRCKGSDRKNKKKLRDPILLEKFMTENKFLYIKDSYVIYNTTLSKTIMMVYNWIVGEKI
jgi:dephospho-CoA kinase